jgi:hypothetical protein
MACLHGHTVVIRSLLKCGARPETADFVSAQQNTCRRLTTLRGTYFQPSLFPYSVAYHSLISDTKFGQNALHYSAACSKLNRCVVIQLLVDTKMDLNLKDHVSDRSD